MLPISQIWKKIVILTLGEGILTTHECLLFFLPGLSGISSVRNVGKIFQSVYGFYFDIKCIAN